MDYRKHNRPEPWDDGVYGTGRTEPPKNNNGIIALLLIMIIFLSGIVSVLSFWNIRLFHQLQQIQQQTDSVPMAFSDSADRGTGEENMLEDAMEQDTHIPFLGLHGEYVAAFDQHYFSWPAGLMVAEVEPDSLAEQMGIEPGDILISANGLPITCQEELDAFLTARTAWSDLELTVFREGLQYTFHIRNSQ